MKLIDTDHAFYQPLWRRIAIVAVCAIWFAFEALVSHSGLFMFDELVSQSGLFMALSGAALVYTAWTLIIRWKPGAQP